MLAGFIGCAKKEGPVINPADYQIYLNRKGDAALDKVNSELEFWRDKLKEIPDSETYRTKLAGLYSSRFMLSGLVEDINTADSLFHLIISTNPSSSASIYRALAANAITRHQFRQAREHLKIALEIGDGKAATLLMIVDVNVELGDYAGAKFIMKDFTNKNSFQYLIREAKLKDHEGKLDSAILIMEKAMQKVNDNAGLFLWTQSNLGDMYGHAGRIKEAYQSYLRVLEKDPDYDYALKGIAWIAFSHDENTIEAKKLINNISQKKSTPDLHLLLAEIAEAENDHAIKKLQLAQFHSRATQPKYGDMYNKHIALLEAEEFSNAKRAIEIAKKEIHNRPTPQSYDLLAWGYYSTGAYAEALELAQQKVENKTFEPEALYHLGMIYAANDLKQKSEILLREAAASSFELGPSISNKIKARLE